MIERGVRHFVAAAAVAAVLAYASLFGRLDSDPPIHSDGYTYYVYLQSVFIYHDVTLEKLAADWYGGVYPAFTGILRWPTTHRLLNLHPIGTAILMAPFVLVADRLTVWSNLPREGSRSTTSTAPVSGPSSTCCSVWRFCSECCVGISATAWCSRR